MGDERIELPQLEMVSAEVYYSTVNTAMCIGFLNLAYEDRICQLERELAQAMQTIAELRAEQFQPPED